MMRSSSHNCNEWTAITQEDIMERHSITQSNNNNLVEQRNVTMGASLPLWCGLYCQWQFSSTLSPYPTGPEPQTQRMLLYSWKEKTGMHDEVPERPFTSEVECCHWTLYLIVPHIIQLIMLHTGTCQQERCVRLNRDELSSRDRSVGREKGSCAACLGKWPYNRAAQISVINLGGRHYVESQCQKMNDISWGLLCRWLEAERRIHHQIMPCEPKVYGIHIQLIGPILNIHLFHGKIYQCEPVKAK